MSQLFANHVLHPSKAATTQAPSPPSSGERVGVRGQNFDASLTNPLTPYPSPPKTGERGGWLVCKFLSANDTQALGYPIPVNSRIAWFANSFLQMTHRPRLSFQGMYHLRTAKGTIRLSKNGGWLRAFEVPRKRGLAPSLRGAEKKGTGSESSRCREKGDWLRVFEVPRKGDWLRVFEVPVPFSGTEPTTTTLPSR